MVGGVENNRVAAWYYPPGGAPGHAAVILDIQRQPGANIVQTVDRLKQELPALQRAMPAAITTVVVTDRTETIRASVADVQGTLALSIVLVVLVIYLFLRSWRATLIPAIALPLSLIGTFGVMALCGYGLDNLSLMALAVATGFVVDDAIVMIENVVRYLEQGEPPLAAAYKGAAQIGFTIVSLTVSLIAVFIPLLFMTGVVGRLFSEFAITLSVAVVVSALVSLTLTPMMCGRLLRPAREQKPWLVARLADAGFTRLLAGYAHTLRWSLRHQTLMLVLAAATLAGTIFLYVIIPKGFLPLQDTGVIVAVTEAAQSISIARMTALQAQAAAIVRADPAVHAVASFVGAGAINPTPNTGRLTIALQPAPRPRRRRQRHRRPPAGAACRHPRPVGVHAAGAGHPDRHPRQPHPVPVHADRHRPGRAVQLGAAPAGASAPRARTARRRHRPAGRRVSHLHPRRPRRRHAPRRIHAGGAGHAVRRLRPAPGLHHLRPGQPVPRGAGGRPVLAGRSRLADPPAHPRHRRRAGAADRHRQHRAHHRPARRHPPGAVPRR